MAQETAKPSLDVEYHPHAAQETFHLERQRYLWRALIGGTASGKTEAGCAEAIAWSNKWPRCVGAVYEPTYPMLTRILIPKLDKLLGSPFWKNPLIREYRRIDGLIVWREGSQTWLNSLTEPERAEGQNLDWAWIDEARLVPKLDLALQVIGRRLRGSGSGSPLGAWITTTPDHPGSELYKFLEDPRTRETRSKIYRMSIYDNPYLPKSYIENMKKVHSGGLAERFLLGRFADVGAGTYPFDYSIHVMEPPEELRVVVYGVDLGWTNPSAVIPVGFDGDGRAYALDEAYKSQLSEQGLINECRLMKQRYGNGWFICDRSEPRTIMELQRGGLMARADASKFDDGVREIGGRFTKAGDGRCRLYVSANCINLIEELQTYDASKPKGSQRDHAADALRYALASVATTNRPAFRVARRPDY